MRRSAKILAITTATALSFALAACGGSPDTPSNSTDPESTELTVWAWDPVFNVYAMEEAAKIYQKDHPGFKLNVIETPWDEIQTKVTTLAQSQQFDELPDIFLMQNNTYQKNVTNYPDVFSALPDSAEFDYSEFPDSVINYSIIDGKHYGVPFDNGTAIAAYRTDVLEQAGYTVDDFTDITWNEFITKAKDVLVKTGQPLLSGQAGSIDMIVMMLVSAGASFFSDDDQANLIDNDALKAAIDTYQEMVDAGVFVEVNSWDEYIGSFVNGNVAGTIQGCWILGSIQTAADQSGLWAITNLPRFDGLAGATNYSANGGGSWAISSTANVEVAADFLRQTFAGSTELYDTILPSSGALANWIPAGESSVYAKPQAYFGGDAIYAKIVEYAAQVPSHYIGAYDDDARDVIGAAVTKILNGTSVDVALEEAQANLEFAMN